jgi:hypothetical protein
MVSSRTRAVAAAGALLALCLVASIQLQEGGISTAEESTAVVRESDSIQDALDDLEDDEETSGFQDYNKRRADRDDSDDLSEEEKALIDAADDGEEEHHRHHSSREKVHIMKWSQVAGVHNNPKNFKAFRGKHRQWNEQTVAKQMDEGETSDEDDLSREERELIAAASKHPRGKATARKPVKEAHYVHKRSKHLEDEDLRRTRADESDEKQDEDELSAEERDLLAQASGKKSTQRIKKLSKEDAFLRKDFGNAVTAHKRKKVVSQAKRHMARTSARHEHGHQKADEDDLTHEERDLIAAAEHKAKPEANKVSRKPKVAAKKIHRHQSEGLLTVNVDLKNANAEEFVEVEKKIPARAAAKRLAKKFEAKESQKAKKETDDMEKAMERITKAATKHAVQMQTKHLFDQKPAPVKTQVRDHQKVTKNMLGDQMSLTTEQTMVLPSMQARQVIGRVVPAALKADRASEIKTKFAEKVRSVKVVDTWAQRLAAADKKASQAVRSRQPGIMKLSAQQLKNAAELRQQLEKENPPSYMTAPPPRFKFAPYVRL